MMDCCPLKSLPLLLLLLKSTSITWLQGDPAKVEEYTCINDYLFTINCSVSIKHPVNTLVGNQSFWLTITELSDGARQRCQLTNTTAGFFCSVSKADKSNPLDIFSDMHVYNISFCQRQDHGPEVCQLLEEDYQPMDHIKPNAPCCLTVSHNSSRHIFTWKSTYEKYSSDTVLPEDLTYQLLLYRTGDKHGNWSHEISTQSITHCSVEDQNFEPDTEYAAIVRSGPDMDYFEGQWSEWSSKVLWRTVKAAPLNGFTFNLPLMFIIISAVVLILMVGYGSARKWRRGTFIPTPAPYFQSLYKDCQGDFKSWVVTQENTADILKAEEALQIDTLIEYVEGQEYPATFPLQLVENRAYGNIQSSPVDSDLLSMQYSDGSTIAQRRSIRSLPGCCQSCSPLQDSGCWLCSDTSLEKEPSWYCNEYCTLGFLQEAGCVTAGHHGGLKTNPNISEMIDSDAVIEA
ncbi:interleukin-21 receptor [Cyprinodon tularosa]|uniref:interleukin-21 receptor n=1 Tax=Cyprinodon tularosa TaxID=77115 RepID=UPI0018E22AFD|nr:interleukin-21 receptor [Cyprinodon tularosa]